MGDTNNIQLDIVENANDNNANDNNTNAGNFISAIEETAIQPNPDSWQTIFLNITSHLINFIPNLLFLNFSGINDSKIYNVFLFFLWAGIAALVWLISIGIEKPQIVFTLYCCSAWLIGLAVIFLFNV
jgi:L-cystine uptake protein TcyP (sodium:dicarboxylate symporter family)